MRKMVMKAMDIDQWKHSWHNELKAKEDFQKANEVLRRKITDRLGDLIALNEALQVSTNLMEREFEAELEEQDD